MRPSVFPSRTPIYFHRPIPDLPGNVPHTATLFALVVYPVLDRSFVRYALDLEGHTTTIGAFHATTLHCLPRRALPLRQNLYLPGLGTFQTLRKK